MFNLLHGMTLVTCVGAYCWTALDIESVPTGYKKITYTASEEILGNPGRGYIQGLTTHSKDFQYLSEFQLDVIRLNTGTTLILRMYVLDDFVNSIISADFIGKIRSDLSIVTDRGFMVVLRFSYTTTLPKKAPYGDGTKEWMKVHIRQLRDIFQEFQGIILAVQAGFIGTWGEWYYSDNFGYLNLTSKNWEDRRDIVQELLLVIPTSIQVQLRTPKFKRTMFGTSPTTYRDVSTRKTKARIGFHNDCFLSAYQDAGTYKDLAAEYVYHQNDNMFVIAGGQTCALTNNNRHQCPTAMKELKELHFTFISRAYNEDVLNEWKTGGCYGDVRNKLGYRLSLKQSILPTRVKRGDTMSYNIVLVNSGFAAPVRQMNVYLVLLSGNNGIYKIAIDTDTRIWTSENDIVISGAAKIPTGMPNALYNVTIAIGDKIMHEKSDYYIVLANNNMKSQDQGTNDLNHVIEITDEDDNDRNVANKCPSFSSWNLPSYAKHPRVLGESGCVKSRLLNHDFESGSLSWNSSNSGFTHHISDSEAKHGSGYIKVTDGDAYQYLGFIRNSKEIIKKMVVRGWSRHSGHVVSDSIRYSIYCDVYPTTGPALYGLFKPFQSGKEGTVWHNTTLQITTDKGIDHALCYFRYYNKKSGYAYFDLFELWILTGDANFTDCHMDFSDRICQSARSASRSGQQLKYNTYIIYILLLPLFFEVV